MALKSDRNELQTDISFFMNEVATRGGVVCYSTGGSGSAMDQGQALCTYAADGSGKVPLGLLLNDMVNIDLTRQHLNWMKDEVQKGGKVTLLRNGWVVTSSIEGANPTAGSLAYVAHSGNVAGSDIMRDDSDMDGGSRIVGRWMSSPDQDGYAKLEVSLPNVHPASGYQN